MQIQEGGFRTTSAPSFLLALCRQGLDLTFQGNAHTPWDLRNLECPAWTLHPEHNLSKVEFQVVFTSKTGVVF